MDAVDVSDALSQEIPAVAALPGDGSSPGVARATRTVIAAPFTSPDSASGRLRRRRRRRVVRAPGTARARTTPAAILIAGDSCCQHRGGGR